MNDRKLNSSSAIIKNTQTSNLASSTPVRYTQSGRKITKAYLENIEKGVFLSKFLSK